MKPFFTFLILLLSFAARGQKFELSVMKRVIRILPLKYSANAPLNKVKDKAGNTITIFQVITDALLDGRLKAYAGPDDTAKLLTFERILQRITDSNGNRIVVNNLVLFENFGMDDKHKTSMLEELSIAPSVQGDTNNIKDITPLFYIKYIDFYNLVEGYKVRVDGTPEKLQVYFTHRYFKSTIYAMYLLQAKPDDKVDWDAIKLLEEFMLIENDRY
ncbi:MAG: hypothetical protein JST82_01385 [Bacteroidetes bacterium]|nr:hypothetical protein [Bacteroidota bacterium]